MNNNSGLFIREPYHIINLLFAGIILMIFIYSGIFSAEKNNYPIQSSCAEIENHPCKSEGLSRSFSEIVRLDFNSARAYNKYGIRVFSFFLIQLFLRVTVSLLLHYHTIKQDKLVVLDSVISIMLYFYCFWGIIT